MGLAEEAAEEVRLALARLAQAAVLAALAQGRLAQAAQVLAAVLAQVLWHQGQHQAPQVPAAERAL